MGLVPLPHDRTELQIVIVEGMGNPPRLQAGFCQVQVGVAMLNLKQTCIKGMGQRVLAQPLLPLLAG